MNEFFHNELGRIRSGWRAIIFAVIFLFFSSMFGVALVGFVAILTQDKDVAFLNSPSGMLITSAITLIIATIAGWICGKVFEDLPLKALGWAFHKSWILQSFLGLLIGGLAMFFAAAIAMPSGGLSFSVNNSIELSSILQAAGFSVFVLLVAAASEEVLFRGYLLQTLVRAKLAWLGILVTSLPFALVHLGNPNAELFSTLNTALAGVWLGLAYLKTRSLWFVLGIHFAWNWVQGSFLGLPISGLTNLTKHSLLQFNDQGPTWLTGGSYGIEGGIACTISLLFSMLVVWFFPFIKADEEMLELTSIEVSKGKSFLFPPPPPIF
jgi:uncharacterized protein